MGCTDSTLCCPTFLSYTLCLIKQPWLRVKRGADGQWDETALKRRRQSTGLICKETDQKDLKDKNKVKASFNGVFTLENVVSTNNRMLPTDQ